MYLRINYAYYSDYANQVRVSYTRYIGQRERLAHARLLSNAIIAGDSDFCDLATIGENQHSLADGGSAMLSDEQVERRLALNARLEGLGRPEFAAWARASLKFYLPAIFNPSKGRAWVDGLLYWYDLADSQMNRLIDDYGVRYVAIPVDRTDPGYLREGWRLIDAGPYWRIWERQTSREASLWSERWREPAWRIPFPGEARPGKKKSSEAGTLEQ
jgi:hypothetical protein